MLNSQVLSHPSLSPLKVWAIPGMERIGISDRPGTATEIHLSAARGEYEPFQIGIRAWRQDLTNVNVAISDLRGSNQQIIPSQNLTRYREHFVYVNYPSPNPRGPNRSLGKNWYADGLIPFVDPTTGNDLVGAALDAAPFSVKAGQNQPIWVDVFVPRNVSAGQYRGTFTVTSDQGSYSGTIHLQVWNFELPRKASLQSSFGFYEDQTKAVSIEFLKHRLNPQFKFNPQPQLERELIDRWGLTSINLPFWSGAEMHHCQMTPPPSIVTIRAQAELHQPDLFKYIYSADEIDRCPHLYPMVKQWGRTIHQAGFSNLVVMAPVPELYDDGSGSGRSAVSIWVVLPKMYENAADRITHVLSKGDQVWSYNSLVQDGYSPKWQIDFAPMNFRIQSGFLSQSLGLTGLLYWRVDLWTEHPWQDIHTFFDRSDDNRPYPGDGMLVYPGAPVGVTGIVPSMRLKWLREGVEDYEYVAILKRLGATEQALEMSRSIGRDWSHWTQDSKALESVRQQLAQAIEQRSPLKGRDRKG